jgi:flagellin-like protein
MMFRNKRAITPVIATLLLIAITVAAVAGFYIFYNAFIKQSKVSGDNPSITVSGPSTGNIGDRVVVSIKNSGNADLSSWEMTFPDGTTEGSTTTLTVGSQRSFSYALDSTNSGAWEFNVDAETAAGSACQDLMVIESA